LLDALLCPFWDLQQLEWACYQTVSRRSKADNILII
jgi:hypothetical protein